MPRVRGGLAVALLVGPDPGSGDEESYRRHSEEDVEQGVTGGAQQELAGAPCFKAGGACGGQPIASKRPASSSPRKRSTGMSLS